jgi:YNFM family putative membrane transporter
MGVMVGIYNAIGFRLQAAPFNLGTGASLIYLAYPVGILAPQVMRGVSARGGRGVAVTSAAILLALSVLVVSLPSLVSVFMGLGLVTFAFLGTHSLLSGWVVDRAKRQGIGTAQASSGYLLTYYLGSTVAGVAATQLWQTRGWTGVEWLSLGLVAVAILSAVLAARADR